MHEPLQKALNGPEQVSTTTEVVGMMVVTVFDSVTVRVTVAVTVAVEVTTVIGVGA